MNVVRSLLGVEDTPEAFYELMIRHHLGDGFPAIPPTPERVNAMLAASGRKPNEIVAVMEPRFGVATIETIAANAVMAGCRPEYFPVVVAALESTIAGLGLVHLSTTNSATPLLVVNGPARHKLGINFSESCFGVAGRANATIGRAVRLCLINIAGSIPRLVSKSVFGQPGRYSMCIGEWDEMNPWAPLHVQRGFSRDDNCVTALGATGTINITDIWCRTAESILLTIAHTINTTSGAWIIVGHAEITIVLNPNWAETIARGNFSLEDARQFLWEKSRLPLDQFPEEYHAPLRKMGHVLEGDLVPQTDKPERFNIIVAGGAGGLHAIACHGLGPEASIPYAFSVPGISASGPAPVRLEP